MKQELTKAEIEAINKRNLNTENMERYRAILEKGYPFIKLAGICTRGEEIKTFSETEKEDLRSLYRDQKDLRIVKFVPASGAASRMFKDLFTALERGQFSEKVNSLFTHLKLYAFAKEWLEKAGMPEKETYTDSEKKELLKVLLLPEGMDYGNLPKGMIAFHQYPDGHVRTAFEEHFHEGAMYARSGDKTHLHFTIPADNQEVVKAHLQSLTDCLNHLLKTEFIVETSIQKSSTDTPAIYEDTGDWVRTSNGELLFRPAGHGALLENLNGIEADLIFVKNIDNVVPDSQKPTTVANKELLAGVLLKAQKGLFKHLQDLQDNKLDIPTCEAFVQKWFGYSLNGLTDDQIHDILNRPLRVCGMVKNEGEPGGGPFIVDEGNGQSSLQIVEGAQIEPGNPSQEAIAKSATHFNPVDLVIGMKGFRGKTFNLLEYRNNNTGMVVSKNYQSRNIRALELPGLWNGSMHFWNTIFVEVPIATFNPVKTVFDLSREAHRG